MYKKLKLLHNYLLSNGLRDEAAKLMSLANLGGASCDKIIKEGPDHWKVNCTMYGRPDELRFNYTYTLWNGPNENDGIWVNKNKKRMLWIARPQTESNSSEHQSEAKHNAWETLEAARREIEASKIEQNKDETNVPEVTQTDIMGDKAKGRHYGPEGSIGTTPSDLAATNPGLARKLQYKEERELFESPLTLRDDGARFMDLPEAEWLTIVRANFSDYKIKEESASLSQWESVDMTGTKPKVISISPRSYDPDREQSSDSLIIGQIDAGGEMDEWRFNVAKESLPGEATLSRENITLDDLYDYLDGELPTKRELTSREKRQFWWEDAQETVKDVLFGPNRDKRHA